MKTPDFQSCQTRTQPCPQEPIRRRQLRPLHGALQDADLVAQRKNLQLKSRTAPKRGDSEAMTAVERVRRAIER